jgi:tRNA G10  N-methylase Trm11
LETSKLTEYKSELESLAPCRELLFDGTPGFGRYASLLSHAVGHPAKMNTRLTEYLILELTKPGELVLDNMSGTGQTGIIATLNGRDAVCVELEQKFHDWQLQAKKKLSVTQTFVSKGSLNCLKGDARKLTELLKVADCVVTSPPYSDMKKGKLDAEDWANRMEKFGSTPDSRRERHTPGRLKGAQSMSEGYSESPDNIGNLPMGDIDAIITSPPYSEGIGHGHAGQNANHEYEARLQMQERYASAFESEGNIGVLKHGEVDAVITSPPYEKTVKDHGKSDRATKINIEKNNTSSFSYNADNPDNIGNKSKETYLEAMLQVYSEMFQVLKPGGVAAIIVKPFVRNRKVVDLPFQTWLLMQKCGFELIKIYKQRLDQQSFWRILYMQKNPEVPQIWHEWVLVCTKPQFSSSEIDSKKEPKLCNK